MFFFMKFTYFYAIFFSIAKTIIANGDNLKKERLLIQVSDISRENGSVITVIPKNNRDLRNYSNIIPKVYTNVQNCVALREFALERTV